MMSRWIFSISADATTVTNDNVSGLQKEVECDDLQWLLYTITHTK